jgi:hypothetical protein
LVLRHHINAGNDITGDGKAIIECTETDGRAAADTVDGNWPSFHQFPPNAFLKNVQQMLTAVMSTLFGMP